MSNEFYLCINSACFPHTFYFKISFNFNDDLWYFKNNENGTRVDKTKFLVRFLKLFIILTIRTFFFPGNGYFYATYDY